MTMAVVDDIFMDALFLFIFVSLVTSHLLASLFHQNGISEIFVRIVNPPFSQLLQVLQFFVVVVSKEADLLNLRKCFFVSHN